jgi:CheY-like chemotaxis protein
VSKRAKAKEGRPPAGRRPGVRSSEYPRFALRLPAVAHDRLLAMAEISGRPQWRVLSDAIDAYIKELPDDQQQLLQGLLDRAEPLLTKPVRTTRELPLGIAILNVDDNEAMRFARSTMLRNEGFEVIDAPTGHDALALLETHHRQLSVVVLDVNLPDISGIEVCRAIKADSRFRHIRVVQTSATFSSPHDQLRGLESGGADIYLAEPVPRGTLLSIIRRLVEDIQSGAEGR